MRRLRALRLLTYNLKRKCFNEALQVEELEGIRKQVRRKIEGGILNDGLTEAGFIYLHTRFIRKGRSETTWTVLRKFGYAEDLRLTEEFLCPKSVFILIFSFYF